MVILAAGAGRAAATAAEPEADVYGGSGSDATQRLSRWRVECCLSGSGVWGLGLGWLFLLFLLARTWELRTENGDRCLRARRRPVPQRCGVTSSETFMAQYKSHASFLMGKWMLFRISFCFGFGCCDSFEHTHTILNRVPLAAGVDAGRSSDGNKKDGSAAYSSVCLVRAAVASGRTASIAPSLSHDGRRSVWVKCAWVSEDSHSVSLCDFSGRLILFITWEWALSETIGFEWPPLSGMVF